MNQEMTSLLVVGFALWLSPIPTNAQEIVVPSAVPEVVAGPHGGALRQLGQMQVETIASDAGIQVFVFDRSGEPVAAGGGRGVAAIRVAGGAKRYRYDLMPDEKGGLRALVNLSKVAGRQLTIEVQLVGIPSAGTSSVSYKELATVPLSELQLAAAAIARQKTCPVSGKPLGSMGQPVKLLVGGKPLFLCCKGCVKKVQAEPAKYLAIVDGKEDSGVGQMESRGATVAKGTEEIRSGVFKVSAADKPFIAAQKKCPVMDEPLGAMGGPYKVNAAGKAIYICCPGCAKKIAADPEKYLALLKSQGVAAPVIE